MVAVRAEEDIPGVSPILRNQIPRKEPHMRTAPRTWGGLDPQEVLHGGVGPAAEEALCAVQMADLRFQIGTQAICCLAVLTQIQVLDFLTHDPIGHGIDVKPGHVTAHPVRLHQWRSSAHERVGDMTPAAYTPYRHFASLSL